MIRNAFVAFAALFTVACSSPSGPSSRGLQVSLAVQQVAAWPSPPEPVFAGGVNSIVVQGGLTTLCPGYTLEAHADGRRTINLTVAAQGESEGGCSGPAGYYTYQATIRGLASGTDTVNMIHQIRDWPGDSNPETQLVATGTVQVG